MADTYNDFLYKYFQQLHLSAMPGAQKEKLEDLRGDAVPVMIGDVQATDKDGNLIFRYPNDRRTPAQKQWKIDTQLPDINSLDDKEVEKLYRAFLGAIRAMDGNKDLKIDKPKLPEKWVPFFDASKDGSKPFYPFEPHGEAPKHLEELLKFIKNKESPIVAFIETDCFDKGAEYGFSQFIEEFESGKYSDQFINQIDVILRQVRSNSYRFPGDDNLSKFDVGGDFFKIPEGLDPENEPIESDKISTFKKDNFAQLASLIYSNEDFRTVFGSTSSGSDIVKILERVKKNTDYSKVARKESNEKTVLQKMKKNVDDWFEGSLAKLGNKHLRHKYSSVGAKGIMDAVTKAKFNPTEGLGKLLEKNDEITKNITENSPVSAKAWEKFVEILKSTQSGAKEEFNGALKNGKQAKAIVKKIISRFMEGEISFDEAKQMEEAFSVMTYGLFTSENWAEWKKNKINLFDGVKGMDKGFLKAVAIGTNWAINTTANVAFWGVQLAFNKYNKHGTKFKKSKKESILKDAKDNEINEQDLLKNYEQKYAETEDAVKDPNVQASIGKIKAEASVGLGKKEKDLEDDEVKLKAKEQKFISGVVSFIADPSNNKLLKDTIAQNSYDRVMTSKIVSIKSGKSDVSVNDGDTIIKAIKEAAMFYEDEEELEETEDVPEEVDDSKESGNQIKGKSGKGSQNQKAKSHNLQKYAKRKKLRDEKTGEKSEEGSDNANISLDNQKHSEQIKGNVDRLDKLSDDIKADRDKYDKLKKEFDDAKKRSTSSSSILVDLKKQKKDAGENIDPNIASDFDGKISAMEKKVALESAKANLDNKRAREEERKAKQKEKFEPETEEKSKYDQASELFAFWDFLNTKEVNDWGGVFQPFNTGTIKKLNKNIQTEFYQNNPFGQYKEEWKNRYENAA